MISLITKKPARFKRSCRTFEKRFSSTLEQAFSDTDFERTKMVRELIESGSLAGRSNGFSFSRFLDVKLPDRYWLAPEKYDFLRGLSLRGNLASLTLDIADDVGCSQLEGVLDEFGVRADFFHVSNALDFMADNRDWVNRDASPALLQSAIGNVKKLSKPSGAKLISDDRFLDVDTLELASFDKDDSFTLSRF